MQSLSEENCSAICKRVQNKGPPCKNAVAQKKSINTKSAKDSETLETYLCTKDMIKNHYQMPVTFRPLVGTTLKTLKSLSLWLLQMKLKTN